MQIYTGTSGYSYKEWKGPFYPADLSGKDMLRYYSSQLPAVEINNTFYRMPAAGLLESWGQQVPPDFRFVLKAPRKITHNKPLKEKDDEIDYFLRTTATLGDRLGAVLFQLPPYLRKNPELLINFLELLPSATRSAFEFRHRSWFDQEIYDLLRQKGCTLCCSDGEDESLTRLVATSGWGYLRLRRQNYSETDLSEWAGRIKSQDWRTVYVFFKHEEAGAGPKLARHFLELASRNR